MPPSRRKPRLSPRKRAAILANLAKANAVRRTPASYARSRHNALKHGMFVRSPQHLFCDYHGDAFRRLHNTLRHCFAPHGRAEAVLIRRLAEAIWRRLQAFVGLASWQEGALRKQLSEYEREANLNDVETLERADCIIDVLLDHQRFWQCEQLTRREVERMLRLLLVARGNKIRSPLWIGRQGSERELAELSPNPNDWQRRYAAAVPLPKTVKEKNRSHKEGTSDSGW